MVSIFQVIQGVVRHLIKNPLYLIFFALWLVCVVAEFELIESNPISWLEGSVNKTTSAGAAVNRFNNYLKDNLHKFLIISGLFMNAFFCANSKRIRLINFSLIGLVLLVKLNTRTYIFGITFVVGEFLFCSINSDEYKLYVIIAFCLIVFFESEITQNVGNKLQAKLGDSVNIPVADSKTVNVVNPRTGK